LHGIREVAPINLAGLSHTLHWRQDVQTERELHYSFNDETSVHKPHGQGIRRQKSGGVEDFLVD